MIRNADQVALVKPAPPFREMSSEACWPTRITCVLGFQIHNKGIGGDGLNKGDSLPEGARLFKPLAVNESLPCDVLHFYRLNGLYVEAPSGEASISRDHWQIAYVFQQIEQYNKNC